MVHMNGRLKNLCIRPTSPCASDIRRKIIARESTNIQRIFPFVDSWAIRCIRARFVVFVDSRTIRCIRGRFVVFVGDSLYS